MPVAAYAGDERGRRDARRQRVEKPGNVRRIVLSVPVEKRDQGRPRRPDAGDDGRTLSAAPAQTDDPKSGTARLRFGEALPGLVAASVVDINDLVAQADAGKRRFDLGDQRQDIFGLVEDRNDDRECRRVDHGASDTKTAPAHPSMTPGVSALPAEPRALVPPRPAGYGTGSARRTTGPTAYENGIGAGITVVTTFSSRTMGAAGGDGRL